MPTAHRLLAFLLFASLLSACGGSAGSDPAGPSSTAPLTLSGQAAKGILRNASVSVYAVVGGQVASTPLETVRSSDDGRYSFSLPATDSPLVIEVQALPGVTKMLDESRVDSNGNFAEVDVQSLRLRSFVTRLNAATTVHVNPLTEVALQLAQQATQGSRPAGLTPDALSVGIAAATQIMGRDPFITAPAARASDMTDLHVLMAGIAASASTSCDIQCQISRFVPSGPSLSIEADGRATLSADALLAIAAQRTRTLNQAVLALQGTPAAAVAESTRLNAPALSATLQTAAAQEAARSFEAFVTALRTGFKAAEKAIQDRALDLQARYADVTVASIRSLGGLLRHLQSDCLQGSGSGFACQSRAGSPFQWTPSGTTLDTFDVAGTYDGYSISASVTGSVTAGRTSATITRLRVVHPFGQTAYTADTLAAVISEPAAGRTDRVFTLSGAVQAYDENAGSAKFATLTFSDIRIAADSVPADRPALSVNGALSIATSTGDQLTGALNLRGFTYTQAITRIGFDPQGRPQPYTETLDQSFFTTVSVEFSAASQDGPLLALGLHAAQEPMRQLNAPPSEGDFTRYSHRLTLAHGDDVQIQRARDVSRWDEATDELRVQAGGSGFTLATRYTRPTGPIDPTIQWCDVAEAVRCATSIELASVGRVYTATLKPVNGQLEGDIYKGTLRVGALRKGILAVNGKEVSLY